jgi:pimeloyl-ACP methyl ester carboxylesterase
LCYKKIVSWDILLPKSKKLSYYFFILVCFFFLLFWVAIFSYQQILQSETKRSVRLDGNQVVDELIKLKLGGAEQWIRVRGKNWQNPILLFLHGGPGAPLFPAIKKIGVDTGIESSFTLVYWEQRGTGKSYHSSISPQSMTISQLISDTFQLSIYLQEKYQRDRIYLLGRSFGSLIGLLTAQKYPELFYAYVGLGQLISPLTNDSLSYDKTLQLAREQSNLSAINDLLNIGYPPYDYRQVLRQRRWLTRLTAVRNLSNHPLQKEEFFSNLQELLATPEYSLLDILRMGRRPLFSIQHLWNQDYYRINLIKSIDCLDLPVFFLCGRYDDFTPPELVEKFYERLETARGKSLIWFENSGHHPEYEEPVKFREVLERQILPLSKMN